MFANKNDRFIYDSQLNSYDKKKGKYKYKYF